MVPLMNRPTALGALAGPLRCDGPRSRAYRGGWIPEIKTSYANLQTQDGVDLLSRYVLHYPSLEARNPFSERYRTQMETYLSLRLTGHTRAFVVASFTQSRKLIVPQRRSIDVLLNTSGTCRSHGLSPGMRTSWLDIIWWMAG
jgi:hypothetical protein